MALKKKKYSLRAIAGVLNRAVSTVSDEIRRNRVRRSYDARKAHHKAYIRRQKAKYQGMKIAEHRILRDFVEHLLYADQSPRAIAGRLKYRQRILPYVSKNSIHRYIKSPYGRRIEHHRSNIKRRGRHAAPRTKPWKDRTFIDQRPAYINARMRVGDAEGDFIVSGRSGKGRILVITDRKLRVSFLERLITLSLREVTHACLRIKARYPEWKSMTTDNDILFQHHKELEQVLNIRIYFCHPYSSWEKGSVENANKYIRRYIPKRSDISRYTKQSIRGMENRLNQRMMAVLRYRTPHECLERYRKQKKR